MEGMGVTCGKETKEAEPLPMGPHSLTLSTATQTPGHSDHGRQVPGCLRTSSPCSTPKVPARGSLAACSAALESGLHVALAFCWAAGRGGWQRPGPQGWDAGPLPCKVRWRPVAWRVTKVRAVSCNISHTSLPLAVACQSFQRAASYAEGSCQRADVEPFGQERAPLGRQLLCRAAASEPTGSREVGGGNPGWVGYGYCCEDQWSVFWSIQLLPLAPPFLRGANLSWPC